MNNFDPIVKPTPLPKIVKDRNREPSSNIPPNLSNSAPITHNANATPSKGGFMDNLNEMINNAQAKAKVQTNTAKARQGVSQNGPTLKRRQGFNTKTIGWFIGLFFVLPYFFGIIGTISDGFEEFVPGVMDEHTSNLTVFDCNFRSLFGQW